MNIPHEVKSELLDVLKKESLFGFEYTGQISFQNKSHLNNELPNSLDKLEEYVDNCSLCSLSKRKNSNTFYRANLNSEIMMITLFDNLFEEKEFKYFESLLNSELALNINDIYMTNILKCNVDKYNISLDDEVSKCIQYLEQQISLKNPKLIITIGNSFNYLVDSKEILTDISGNVYNYRGINLFPLLGVDFIGKNPSYKAKMFSDIIKLRKLMD